MNIVHYSFGIPPLRRGGLTKYFIDLAIEQSLSNHVLLIVPDSSKNKKGIIFEKKYFGIDVFKIYDSNPCPLVWGIKEPLFFMKKSNVDQFIDFFKKNRIEVLHVHTLQGALVEMLEAANMLNIRIVYTTHDYFGLCPKSNLWCDNNVCKNINLCAKCNKDAISWKKLKFTEKKYYPMLKRIVKKFKFKNKKSIHDDSTMSFNNENYNLLRNYYYKMLKYVDVFHFNSYIAQDVYKKFLPEIKGKVISISNKSINDKRSPIHINDVIKIGYLGPINEAKGFFDLKEVLDELYFKIKNFELHVFENINNITPYIKINKAYTYKNKDEVFRKLDLIVVPSKWHETFSFICQEALAYGIPVLISENVGAKMIVNSIDSSMVFSSIAELKDKLYKILCDHNILEQQSAQICDVPFDKICPDILEVNQLYGGNYE